MSERRDDDMIRRALAVANPAVLRIALYRETQDPDLAAMPVEERFVRGGAVKAHVVPKEFHETIGQKAFEYLTSGAEPRPPATREEVADLIELYTGTAPTDAELGYGYEELAYDDVPRDAQWTVRPPDRVLDDFHVTIIGAGFSGIGVAVQLGRLGIPYRIVERHGGVGGTWYVNDYPEARCDIPSHLYSYKFEKSYRWKSYFATRDELREYLEYIVDEYGVRRNITCDTELVDASWDDSERRWLLKLRGPEGGAETLRTNVVISASGTFHKPKLPDIDGMDSFRGAVFHTTQWDHTVDYRDKRVALVGTGSTGAQTARALGLHAAHLTIYQRTANWIAPSRGYRDEVADEVNWLFDNMPGYRKWFVFSNYHNELQLQDFQDLDAEWIAKGGRVNEANAHLADGLRSFIESKVGHRPDLLDKVIPTHPPLARRLVIDNEWYETLCRDNVDLVHGGVAKITPTGVVGDDGIERPVDLIVLAAGFDVARYLWPVPYTGRAGASLEELWDRDGARAFQGMALPGFPNFFIMYGPNAQLRIGSFHSWVEILARYISGLIVHMIEQGLDSVEVTREAYDDFNARLDEAMSTKIWEHEACGGYYVNEHGRSGINMPWRLHEFYEMVREPDLDNYRFE